MITVYEFITAGNRKRKKFITIKQAHRYQHHCHNRIPNRKEYQIKKKTEKQFLRIICNHV